MYQDMQHTRQVQAIFYNIFAHSTFINYYQVVKGVYSTQKYFFFNYRDIIYNLFQDMCTYSQLKKKKKKLNKNYVPKLYASSGMDISKCIEGGRMKFTTLVDYI